MLMKESGVYRNIHFWIKKAKEAESAFGKF